MSNEQSTAKTEAALAKQALESKTSPSLCIDSSHLLNGAKAIDIDHAGQRYVLRVTRENKLILTK